MEGNVNPIFQWLATVEEGHNDRQDEGRRADQIRNTGLATNISCIPLETSEIVPGGGHPATRKRDAGCLEQSKASSTHEPVLRDEGHKRARQSYGLKPRHKTHEDHYEYKGPLSALETQSQPRKGRTKRRGCRKHTMNDDFHAMNVTENRLTLRSNAHLGLFSKGRTSSPTGYHKTISSTNVAKPAPALKPRNVFAGSDIAFSEMNFLPQRNKHSPNSMSTPIDAHDQTSARECSQQNMQLKCFLYEPSKQAMACSSNVGLGEKRKMSNSPSHLVISNGASIDKSFQVPSDSQNDTHKSLNKRRKTTRSSSIPYTWSETDLDNPEQGNRLEEYLLNLMHVGLDAETLCPEISSSTLTGQYCSLSELWMLLDERKAAWPEYSSGRETSPKANVEQQDAGAVILKVPPGIIQPGHSNAVEVGSNQLDDIELSSQQNTSFRASSGMNRASPEHDPSLIQKADPEHKICVGQQNDDMYQQPDKHGFLGVSTHATDASHDQGRSTELLDENQHKTPLPKKADNESLPLGIVPNAQRPHAANIDFYELSKVDDDDVFYHTLEAAYHAIVPPDIAAEVASDLQELLASPELNDAPDPLNPSQLIHTADSDSSSLKANAGKQDHFATESQSIMSEIYDAQPLEPLTDPEISRSHSNDASFDGSNELPWLSTERGQPQLHLSAEFNHRLSQPKGLCKFWRQNRLY